MSNNSLYTSSVKSSPELTKREYFAAMAMQGLMASDTRDIPENLAIGSVAVADALIAELNRPTDSE